MCKKLYHRASPLTSLITLGLTEDTPCIVHCSVNNTESRMLTLAPFETANVGLRGRGPVAKKQFLRLTESGQ